MRSSQYTIQFIIYKWTRVTTIILWEQFPSYLNCFPLRSLRTPLSYSYSHPGFLVGQDHWLNIIGINFNKWPAGLARKPDDVHSLYLDVSHLTCFRGQSSYSVTYSLFLLGGVFSCMLYMIVVHCMLYYMVVFQTDWWMLYVRNDINEQWKVEKCLISFLLDIIMGYWIFCRVSQLVFFSHVLWGAL